MPQRLVLSCLLALIAGCARNARPDTEPTSARYEHVFLKPLEEALAETRKILAEKGYGFEPTEDESQLLTTWLQPSEGTQGNGIYSRYFVSGIRVGPRQSVVRIFRVNRAVFGNDIAIKTGGQKLAMEQREQYSNPLARSSVTGKSRVAFQTDAMVERRGLMHGTRDPELEQELTLRLESGAGIEVVAKELAPQSEHPSLRSPDFYLDRWKQDIDGKGSATELCPQKVRGFGELLRSGLTVLIGEQLGSNEAPAAVGDAACESAETGFSVALGLSIPRTEQERIHRYLASPGAPADQDELLRGVFWRRPYQDGRSSRAIMELIDRVRSLRAAGLPITVVAFDTDEATGTERDALLAELWRQRRQTRPEEIFIILAGNTHTRTTEGTAWDRDFVPMAKRMKSTESALMVLDLSYAQGRRWGCDLNRDAKLVCAVVGASPSERVAEAPGQTPFVRLFSTPTEEGHHGLFYVGALSPSLPATSLEGHLPPPETKPLVPPERRAR
ncbi:hypothetical protein [Hyalangium versicolor]|uniref:hypothetical protein n=1 Tax=Hyalangium versicolor TaxID=2861190 RepID=UPI001CC9FDB8|nr:hypothetical protein [Hyalangium versicolor]